MSNHTINELDGLLKTVPPNRRQALRRLLGAAGALAVLPRTTLLALERDDEGQGKGGGRPGGGGKGGGRPGGGGKGNRPGDGSGKGKGRGKGGRPGDGSGKGRGQGKGRGKGTQPDD